MAPKIMIIRHAEKPAKSGEPYGIQRKFVEKDRH
jgi:hypothetical protein